MLFDDDFVDLLKMDPINGVLEMCRLVSSAMDHGAQEWGDQEVESLYECYALFAELHSVQILATNLRPPELSENSQKACSQIFEFVRVVEQRYLSERSKMRIESFRNRFRATLSNAFAYEFSQGDLDRVQILINELRDLIAKAVGLDDGHRQRLLRRLEKLQGELHKKVADLDRFWGLVGDAGVVLGKLGTDAKPIVDRIKEIAGIVWQTQSRSEELPSGSKPPTIESGNKEDVAN
jgi:hypothetical protein